MLLGRDLAIRDYLLYAVGAEKHSRGEEGGSSEVVLDEGALDDVLLAADGGQQLAGEDLACVCLKR